MLHKWLRILLPRWLRILLCRARLRPPFGCPRITSVGALRDHLVVRVPPPVVLFIHSTLQNTVRRGQRPHTCSSTPTWLKMLLRTKHTYGRNFPCIWGCASAPCPSSVTGLAHGYIGDLWLLLFSNLFSVLSCGFCACPCAISLTQLL